MISAYHHYTATPSLRRRQSRAKQVLAGALLVALGCNARSPIVVEAPEMEPVAPVEETRELAPYVTTPMPVVRRMLELAEVTADDVVYDLGAGDGRVVVEAARMYRARGVGIELDPKLCERAEWRARRDGVSDLVEIRCENLLESNISDATVVTIYLLPEANKRLLPKLRALRPGTRIISHDYAIGDWPPVHEEIVPTLDVYEHVLRMWRVGDE